MTKDKPQKEVVNVHGKVTAETHKALKIKQSLLNIELGSRPDMTEVVAYVLNDWGKQQTLQAA
ncbi:MAG: hypothetical protein ACRYG7_07860 [Janthinobacterium lividum]